MIRRSFLTLALVFAFVATAVAKPDTWIEVRTPHFVVVSNSGDKDSRRIADQFEKMRAVFQRNFPAARVDASIPIVVIAVKSQKDFALLEPQEYLAKGQLKPAGLFLQAHYRNYVLLRLDAEGEHPFATVYHEYTHFMVARAQAWLPLWLNEGFAEFYQNTEIRDKEYDIGAPSLQNILLLRERRLLPLATLFAVDYKSPYYHEETKASIFYAESWALVHYLMFKDQMDKTHRLTDYLELVAKDVDPVAAATQAFGDLERLQRELDKYVSRQSFSYLTFKSPIEVNQSEFKVRVLSTSQADAVRADVLACNGREQDAKALTDLILKDDPNSVGALETLGLLAIQKSDFAEAEKWYGSAVKLDSQNFLAHYYYAIATMRQGVLEDRAQVIESSLRTAMKLNPSFAPAPDQLAAFYARQRKNLDEALQLSLSAVKLEPGDPVFRANSANVLLQMDRVKDAISVMQAALKLSKSPEQVAAMQSHIESLQRYQEQRDSQAREDDEYRRRNMQAETASSEEKEVDSEPEEEPAHGAKHTVTGTISEVKCSYPAGMKLKLTGKTGPVSLRARNYYKVPYSALNFTPSSELNPCKDLEGMKARVEYYESTNPKSEGEIISIQMQK